jgi:hypothetical protein
MPFNDILKPLIDHRMREDVREDRAAQAALHHAIATEKHEPIYFRLRNNHLGNGPGNSA